MKRTSIFILLVLIASHLIAQSSVWEVSNHGNKLYLAGTIHLLHPNDFPLPTPFYSALEKSNTLILEADVNKLQDPAIAQSMIQKMTLPEGQTLNTILDEKTYKNLEDECVKVSLPLVNMNQFKPSLIVVTLTSLKMMNLGFSTEGVDVHLAKKAKELSKNIAYLETVDFQIDILSKMGEGNENNFVSYSLEDMNKMETEFQELLSDWKIGDNKKMESSIKEMKDEFPKLYQSLLLDRNNDWINKIDDYLKDETIEMIAVGTLHLHGEEGLLSQLKEKGYKIKQVK